MNKLPIPKFHRQRLILLILELAGGKLHRMDFQKLLFLAHNEADLSHYDFVPFRYGCYSFQASADLETLESLGWIILGDKGISLTGHKLPRSGLSNNEVKIVVDFMRQTNGLRGQKLVRYVYQEYPYFATNSEIAEKILDTENELWAKVGDGMIW